MDKSIPTNWNRLNGQVIRNIHFFKMDSRRNRKPEAFSLI